MNPHRSRLLVGIGMLCSVGSLVFAVLVSPVWWVAALGLAYETRVYGWSPARTIEPATEVPDELAVAVDVLTDPDSTVSLWAGLNLGDERHGYPSVLDGPRWSATGIELLVCPVTGSTITEWRDRADAIADALAVPEVLVSQAGPGTLRLEVRVLDPLADPIEVPQPAELVDLRAVPIGVTDDGQPWTVPLLYAHVLIAGQTGSGKGSALWSLLAGIAPAIRDGLVQVHAIDPKGGVELGAGTALFTRFVPDAGQPAVDLLADAVITMRDRAAGLRELGQRKHVPTVDEPLIVIVVDEAGALSAYQSDRKVRTEIESLLGLLLSQGRAVGVSVVLALQDASKEVAAWRQLVPVRIALRLRESSAVPMVLGAGARDRGARCDLIPDSLPGVGYAELDGRADPQRVRAFWVSDAAIDQLVELYAPVRRPELAVVEGGAA